MLKKEQFTNNAIAPLKIINWERTVFVLLIIITITGIFGSYFYYNKYKEMKANPNLETQKENESLVAALGKLMELPTDEMPTVATIVDKEKLQDQAFFAKAENGDKLLAFTKAMKAILYRPSTNKIIEVAPIVITPPQEAKKDIPATQAPAELRIAYYNGTETVGLSGQTEKTVQTAYPNYQTNIITNASKKDYTENIIIDLTGSLSKEVDELARLLGGSITSLPDGEIRPDADILIISGK